MVRTPQIEVQICAALQAGISRTAACESVNVSRSTFYQWLKTDPAFAEAVARAEAEAEYGFTTTVHETAIGHEVRKIKESRETVVTVRRTLYPDGQVTEEVVPVELVTTSTEESFEFDW